MHNRRKTIALHCYFLLCFQTDWSISFCFLGVFFFFWCFFFVCLVFFCPNIYWALCSKTNFPGCLCALTTWSSRQPYDMDSLTELYTWYQINTFEWMSRQIPFTDEEKPLLLPSVCLCLAHAWHITVRVTTGNLTQAWVHVPPRLPVTEHCSELGAWKVLYVYGCVPSCR